MEKKPYLAPTLTQHGGAVAATLGRANQNVEKINFRGGGR